MNSYFAVEMSHPQEPAKNIVREICQAGVTANSLFKQIQTLGKFEVGKSQFLRCRSDLLQPHPVLAILLKNGRSIAYMDASIALVEFTDGRKGKTEASKLFAGTVQPGFDRTYKGPRIRYWEQQFAFVGPSG